MAFQQIIHNIVPRDFKINEGNYLTAILRENLAQNIFLIYPDAGTNINSSSPNILKEHFIWKQFYYLPQLLDQRPIYSLYVEGEKISITDLYHIPKLRGEVILDIDLDYFICNALGIRKVWLNIEEFVRIIEKKNFNIKSIIISYSIKDGYVSPKYQKYGDILAKSLEILI